MPHDPAQTLIYHITDVENLPGIIAEGGLLSDAQVAQRDLAKIIGYDHIKKRRLTEIRVGCCGGRFVGEFVPFYLCPRSPMLFTINKGSTGRPAGCQSTIVHLVSTVAAGIGLNRQWAISDSNAGAYYASFFGKVEALDTLDWNAIRAVDWRGRTGQKQAELLVADAFPWGCIHAIGCHNTALANRVRDVLEWSVHRPVVTVEPGWYY